MYTNHNKKLKIRKWYVLRIFGSFKNVKLIFKTQVSVTKRYEKNNESYSKSHVFTLNAIWNPIKFKINAVIKLKLNASLIIPKE